MIKSPTNVTCAQSKEMLALTLRLIFMVSACWLAMWILGNTLTIIFITINAIANIIIIVKSSKPCGSHNI